MAKIVEAPSQDQIRGLRLTRKLGDKLEITCGDAKLIIQVTEFWSSWQVKLAFYDPDQRFKILRSEAKQKAPSCSG